MPAAIKSFEALTLNGVDLTDHIDVCDYDLESDNGFPSLFVKFRDRLNLSSLGVDFDRDTLHWKFEGVSNTGGILIETYNAYQGLQCSVEAKEDVWHIKDLVRL